MQTRKELIEEQIATIENYGSEVQGLDTELQYCEPDVAYAREASNFDYQGIDFQNVEAIQRAISNVSNMKDDLDDLKDGYESAAQVAEDGADKLEEILEALQAIKEILEEEVEIEVGQVVFQAEHHVTFRVLAVSPGTWNKNYAWCRDTHNPYAEPVTFQWTQLEIKEEAIAS